MSVVGIITTVRDLFQMVYRTDITTPFFWRVNYGN